MRAANCRRSSTPYLPASAGEFRVAIGEWISKHLSDLQLVGKDAAHMFVTLLIGMVLGAIIALQRTPDVTKPQAFGGRAVRPLAPAGSGLP